MDIVHMGFDGLDIAYKAQIPVGLSNLLEDAKHVAAEQRYDVEADYNGVSFFVAETGAKGGYAFRCDTGPFGAIWFFKKPNAHDPWGIRVSVHSSALAHLRFDRVRQKLNATLQRLTTDPDNIEVSIGRVDYAIDVLAPSFRLDADKFVIHSHAKRKSHNEVDVIRSIGRSGRTTSVTVGSNPNRQVIIYDKRQEVISKPNKEFWWRIWDANLAKLGKGPLVPSAPKQSTIWRVELRAYKRYLKDVWHLRNWDHFDAKFASVASRILADFRYAQPNNDSNRSRWPDSELWQLVRAQLVEGLKEYNSGVTEDMTHAVIMEEYKQLLLSQYLGLAVSSAGLSRVSSMGFDGFIDRLTEDAKALSRAHKTPLARRLRNAADKHAKKRFRQPGEGHDG